MVNETSSFDYKMDLYALRGTRSDRVVWAVHELGLSKHVTVKKLSFDPSDPKHKNMAEMKTYNPMGLIPTMVMTAPDGRKEILTESCAMVYLLAEMCGRLAPAADNVFARAQYLRMMSFAASELDKVVVVVYFNQLFALVKDAAKEAEARKAFDDKLSKVLESVLDGGSSGRPVQWLCEPHHDGFTAAGLIIGMTLSMADKMQMLEIHPTLNAYVQRCAKREAFIKISAEE